eukprot:m.48724 g.48724  ORF g.48724 m.48724 type:complete len:680 (-) comp15960_c0_seq2:188-2227(-)
MEDQHRSWIGHRGGCGGGNTMRGGAVLTVGLAMVNAMAMAKVDLGGPRVLPQQKLMLCGLEGNSLSMWTRFFLENAGGSAANDIKSRPNEVWSLWERACDDSIAPCAVREGTSTAADYVDSDEWTSVLVLRSPAHRVAAAYKKLCPKDSTQANGIVKGFEDTCPMFPNQRPDTYNDFVRALGEATKLGPRSRRGGNPLEYPKLRPQSAACGVDPTHYTHVVVEDSPDYIRWIRTILRSTNIPSATIDKYFSLDSSFKKGDSALGTPAVTASIIESVYAADYALIASDKATATPPPEPETTLPPVPPKEAPDLFCVAMESTSGTFTMEMHKEWSPNGVQRVWDLVQAGFYGEDGNGGIGIFRNAPGFVTQWGVAGKPELNSKWDANTLTDDVLYPSSGVGNFKGYITFAKAGPNTRGSQLFVNLRNNNFLDTRGGFPPVGRCITNCDVAFSFENKYGEQPNQGRLYGEGNAYLHSEFPDLDYFTGAKITPCPAPVQVHCATTKGPIELAVHREWGPNGAAQFLKLIDAGYFNASVPLFRCLHNWLCQMGGTRDTSVTSTVINWGSIDDDTQWLDMSQSAKPWMRKGLLSFAGSGPNSRWGELFFSTGNVNLGGGMWEVPFAELVGQSSFDVLDAFYADYGELSRFGGNAPDQSRIRSEGGTYLDEFPQLDYITGCSYVER